MFRFLSCCVASCFVLPWMQGDQGLVARDAHVLRCLMDLRWHSERFFCFGFMASQLRLFTSLHLGHRTNGGVGDAPTADKEIARAKECDP